MKHLLLATMIILSVKTQSQTIMRIHQSNGTVLQIPLSTIDSITYINSNPGSLPVLTTFPVTGISVNSAISGGNIINDGGSPVTHRGVCWSLSQNPTTANSVISNGGGIGSFTINITNLTPNTTYFIRAYAINNAGTAYGNQLSFTTKSANIPNDQQFNPNLTYGTLTDIDGNTYKTIQIDSQVWMAENLRVVRYNNGVPITYIANNEQWQANTKDAWSHVDDNPNNNIPYGKLYSSFVVSNSHNVCPIGWHIPDDSEWGTLFVRLDPDFNDSGSPVSRLAGGMLKSTGTNYWQSPNEGASNSTGFSGLPAGARDFVGVGSVGGFGFWWSRGIGGAYYVQYDSPNVSKIGGGNDIGFSIRCLKD